MLKELKRIVDKEDISEFCEFLMDMERDEILKLSDGQYDEVMRLIKKFSSRVAEIPQLRYFIFNECYEAVKADEGKNVLENSLLARFHHDCYLSLSVEEDLNYALIRGNKGIVLFKLARLGEKPEKNLMISVKCFKKAASIFEIENWDLQYGAMLVSKGDALLGLAELGINTKRNIRESIDCYDAVLPMLKEKSDEGCASALVGKGVCFLKLAELGINTENNFNSAIENYKEAEKLSHKKFPLIFVTASSNHCLALWWKFRETEEDDYLIDARKIGKRAKDATPFVHPEKDRLVNLINEINDVLADTVEPLKKGVYKKFDAEAMKYLRMLPEINVMLKKEFREQRQFRKEQRRVNEIITQKLEDLKKDHKEQKEVLERIIQIHNESGIEGIEKICEAIKESEEKILNSISENKKSSAKKLIEKISKGIKWINMCYTTKEVAEKVPGTIEKVAEKSSEVVNQVSEEFSEVVDQVAEEVPEIVEYIVKLAYMSPVVLKIISS
ncbi:MAG: hypothetical protein A7316_09955 [Candidatus Altiarchaeales archaeon WOR_SM1_86-2]|nr:MAG: hypothetical protein A7316_09955 [Candidatus Altiarchaeales archaeon WOR_SM1_86-2]ODS37826.1 MAG: hypothetical protein A7315_13150 [Candidatus Altiarchaeales archaeon WOR_SM1_79]